MTPPKKMSLETRRKISESLVYGKPKPVVKTPEFDRKTMADIRRAYIAHFAKRKLDKLPEYQLETII